jgi:K+-sensing histidine kinase KdpD
MNPLDGTLRSIQRLLVLGANTSPPDREPVPAHPERRRSGGTARTTVAVAIATMFPIAFGALLIPLREQLSQSISLLMVLPVLVVALLGGRRLGILAALAAALAFDVFHTLPYYQPTIDDPDDIVETVVLLAIGITAGYLAESAQTAIVAARVRRRELAAMTNFLEHIGTPISAEELGEHASASILSLLDARECVWRPDYMGTASPVLKPDGTLTSMRAGDWDQGGGVLPSTIEIPVGYPPAECGRFIVQTNHRASVSLEERRAAANVATTLSRCIRP